MMKVLFGKKKSSATNNLNSVQHIYKIERKTKLNVAAVALGDVA